MSTFIGLVLKQFSTVRAQTFVHMPVLKSLLTCLVHMISPNLYRRGGLEMEGLIEQFCSLVLPHLYLTTVLPKHKYGFPVGNLSQSQLAFAQMTFGFSQKSLHSLFSFLRSHADISFGVSCNPRLPVSLSLRPSTRPRPFAVRPSVFLALGRPIFVDQGIVCPRTLWKLHCLRGF